ncbi:MAG: UDP-N-acetylmuramoyl-L-alanine--D-glutamate ligase [Ignavibacteriales bacterium]|nr:UDP-N-acetylmuramoyl-L-alanine--D-glutamate ligase [Ignavibacteriales bacterium]
MNSVEGRAVTVIGAERSGVSVARLLKKENAKVFVSDFGKSERTLKNIADLKKEGIECEYGGHSERVYRCSLMVISPGVPTNAPVVVEAHKRGIQVIAEIEVASWFCKGSIIAITGSNGKTTTTTLLGRILSDAKKKHVVAGNIGTAFSSVVLDADEETVVVLEVSSFQLDFIDTFRPKIAVIMNITQNHMDRYEHSMEKYASSKARIFKNQTADDVLIANAGDFWTMEKVKSATSKVLYFSTRQKVSNGAFVEDDILKTHVLNTDYSILNTQEISIKGEHNLQNAMAATLAAQMIGVGPAYIKATLRNFKGVEHRQEFVREVNGIKYINNSKATTVEAVEMALKSYDEPIVLIMGGKDKGNDYTTIYDLVKKKVKAIVATGYSADIIVSNFSDKVRVVKVATIGDAIPNIASMRKTIETATQLADKGDVVLLSPACTSFDWFVDYEERGEVFKQLVHHL